MRRCGSESWPPTGVPSGDTKTLYVGNLGAQVSPDTLRQFLRLAPTDILDLKINKKNKYYAFVTVSDSSHQDILKFNDAEFGGQNLRVNISQQHLPSATNETLLKESNGEKASTGEEDPANVHKYVEIDATIYHDCYNIPQQATIVYAVC